MSTRLLNLRTAHDGKGQVQMMESIGVIIIVTFLLFLGIGFYQKISADAFTNKLVEETKLSDIEVVRRVSGLPELQCSFSQVVAVGCLDTLKLEAFSYALVHNDDHRLFYYPLLKDSTVRVHGIYPQEFTTVIYANNATTNTSVRPSFVPVTLYDPLTRQYGFGVLEVMLS